MPAKTILTLLFFASLCVVVILAFRALPQRMSGDTAERSEEMLVAATMLQIGTLLRAKDVTWQQISGNAGLGQIARPRTPAGNLNLELDQQARAEVYGAALRSSVMAGEPISRCHCEAGRPRLSPGRALAPGASNCNPSGNGWCEYRDFISG